MAGDSGASAFLSSEFSIGTVSSPCGSERCIIIANVSANINAPHDLSNPTEQGGEMTRGNFTVYVVHVPWSEKPMAVFEEKAEAALFVYERRGDYSVDQSTPEIFELECNLPPSHTTEAIE